MELPQYRLELPQYRLELPQYRLELPQYRLSTIQPLENLLKNSIAQASFKTSDLLERPVKGIVVVEVKREDGTWEYTTRTKDFWYYGSLPRTTPQEGPAKDNPAFRDVRVVELPDAKDYATIARPIEALNAGKRTQPLLTKSVVLSLEEFVAWAEKATAKVPA